MRHGKLFFPPLSQVATISIPILDDTLPEPNETFTFSLLPSPGIQIALANAEVTIMDNDGMSYNRNNYNLLDVAIVILYNSSVIIHY